MKLTVEQAISYLKENEFKQWQHFHLVKCGGCTGPTWQQPCPWCDYYPLCSVAMREYLASTRKHTRESLQQQWGRSSLIDILIRDGKQTIAWTSGVWKFREALEAFEKEAREHEWPTVEELWDYVYPGEKDDRDQG